MTFCVAVTLASGLDSTYLPPGPGQTPAPAEARSSTSKYQIIPIVKSVLENEGDGTYRYFNQTVQLFFFNNSSYTATTTNQPMESKQKKKETSEEMAPELVVPTPSLSPMASTSPWPTPLTKMDL